MPLSDGIRISGRSATALRALALLLFSALCACGGSGSDSGGNGGGSSSSGGSSSAGSSSPPTIIAEVLTFPSDSVPAGFAPTGNNAIAIVTVTAQSGSVVTNASILVNGAALT
jgi:hypothetical protein